MKITIEPSADQSDQDHPYPKVTVEIPCDAVNVDDMMRIIVRPALIAAGYSPGDIDAYIPDE